LGPPVYTVVTGDDNMQVDDQGGHSNVQLLSLLSAAIAGALAHYEETCMVRASTMQHTAIPSGAHASLLTQADSFSFKAAVLFVSQSL
jgi:hypothetical protein